MLSTRGSRVRLWVSPLFCQLWASRVPSWHRAAEQAAAEVSRASIFIVDLPSLLKIRRGQAPPRSPACSPPRPGGCPPGQCPAPARPPHSRSTPRRTRRPGQVVLPADVEQLVGGGQAVHVEVEQRQPPPSYSLTMAKVGLVTRSPIPSPRAMPRVNAVLPAPRSPVKGTTSPGTGHAPAVLPAPPSPRGCWSQIPCSLLSPRTSRLHVLASDYNTGPHAFPVMFPPSSCFSRPQLHMPGGNAVPTALFFRTVSLLFSHKGGKITI